MWRSAAFVVLHGVAGSWAGARIVAVATDPATGRLVPGSDQSGPDTGGLHDFATGWDDGLNDHGRPASLTFSPDGRLFVGNDNDGTIFWIAPLGMGFE